MPSRIAKTKTGIGSQAKIWNDNGHFAVQLHSTVVYDETADTIILDNGGWITPTTVRYMNQALDYREVMARVQIKDGEMLCNGQPFENGRFIMTKAEANQEVA